jgi:hypothetical protein
MYLVYIECPKNQETRLALRSAAEEIFRKHRTLGLTSEKRLPYNEHAGWRGILLSPASFSFETLAPRQPAFF